MNRAAPLILIAEDDLPSRELLTEILCASGYRVRAVADGGEAVAALDAAEPGALPDLLIVDIQMPRCDGYGVLAALRERAAIRHLPVIALTGHAMHRDRERGRAAGFDSYLAKPLDVAELRAAVARLLTPKL